MSTNYIFDGAYRGQKINLTFDKNAFEKPDCVLVFPFTDTGLLITHHRKRGWELPGGSIQTGELAEIAAKRETYEETGGIVQYIEPIGQYQIIEGTQRSIKTIFFAYISEIKPLPKGFETDDIDILTSPPSAEELLGRADVSPIMKDGVYRHSLPRAQDLLASWLQQRDSKRTML